MCRLEKCDRHEFDHGLCLPHLKAALGIKDKTTKRKSRKRKVDAEEVVVNDDTNVLETRGE